ncbi:MAG: leucyl aminopeptidase, partial [Proteobacteria bacterium]|nr:leucyl aminopeptidase [Pseudomonadota bacterium]
MEFSIKSGSPEKQRSACVVIVVYEPRKLSLPGEIMNQAADNFISNLLRRGDMEGKPGTTLLLHNVPGTRCDRVLLIGLGKEKDFREKEFRNAVTTATRALNEIGAFDACLTLTELPVKKRELPWRMRQATLMVIEALYRFDRFKSKKDEVRRPLRKMTLTVESRTDLSAAEEALQQAQAIANGMNLAKDLGNLPGNVCTPTYLAEQALQLRKGSKLKVEVLELADMEKLGMGSLLSVTRGSHQPPKFIVVRHDGGGKGEKPIVLIGKGITFDSGGISLKPGPEMDEMKYDMSGAASV